MKNITQSQINDISSQAYLLLDSINEDNISISPRRNNNIRYVKPDIKKNTILNFVAKAYGYTSWSELKITAKNKKDSFSPVYLFESKVDGVKFIIDNIDGIPEAVASSIINILPFKDTQKYKNFPFISQVCTAWGVEIKTVNNKIQLCHINTNENALNDTILLEKLGGLKKLEDIFQKNIDVIRNSYFGEDNKSYINAKKVIIDSF
jgi:hypothetical protein